MKILLAVVVFGLFIIVSFTIFWSNTQSGHFQKECCGCTVDYLPADYEENNCYQTIKRERTRIACAAVECKTNFLDLIKLELARFDYVK